MSQGAMIAGAVGVMLCCSASSAAAMMMGGDDEKTTGPTGGSPGPAPVTYIEGRYVRIKAPSGAVINVSEMGVFDNTGKLISNGKTVTGGSAAHPAGPYANLTNGILADFAHTSTSGEDHVTIDLGGMKKIGEIVLVNRKDCCQDRIVGKKLQILNASEAVIKEIEITDNRMVYTWNPTKTTFESRTLPSGISTTPAWINKGTRPEGPYSFDGHTLEEGDCYNATRAAGHKIYGFRTASHPNPNTCFYYSGDPGWTNLSSEQSLNPESHSIGCTDKTKKIESGCQ
ncbi:hypothetical protein AP053_gp147 [Ostreococcus mediterraneus virus 1]|uniref:hypothetical protein n=1 Tax=Ostreococcus mediterraneus virus 1 TaxID=1663210 RepID=UPI0006CFD9E7|nr:hypothetical protein AP053_gp147 [Ostreococcus mediterraneus virus 1]ALI95258.1 hypothetical protein OmV1_147 [Ostreococcus mediterraneus virus 1]